MLKLILPDRRCCAFRQALLSDPATMAYNAPWFPPDGTIPFPESQWDDFLLYWSHHTPERFLGYLENDAGELVGEICWHHFGQEMGIVIMDSCRKRGYGREGLRLLIRQAFAHPEIPYLENAFEPERTAALHVHLQAGFKPIGTDRADCVILRLDRP